MPVIIISLLVTLLGSIGLIFIRAENNAIKLWIPQQSDFTKNYQWLYENYPPEFRQHSIIIHGDDVLTPEAIQKVSELYKLDFYTVKILVRDTMVMNLVSGCPRQQYNIAVSLQHSNTENLQPFNC